MLTYVTFPCECAATTTEPDLSTLDAHNERPSWPLKLEARGSFASRRAQHLSTIAMGRPVGQCLVLEDAFYPWTKP